MRSVAHATLMTFEFEQRSELKPQLNGLLVYSGDERSPVKLAIQPTLLHKMSP